MSISAERRLQNEYHGREYPRSQWSCSPGLSCQSKLDMVYEDLERNGIEPDINEILYNMMNQDGASEIIRDRLNPFKIIYIQKDDKNMESIVKGPLPIPNSLITVVDQESNDMVKLVDMTKANDRTMGLSLEQAETMQELDLVNRLPPEQRQEEYKRLLNEGFLGHRDPDNMIELVQDAIRSRIEFDQILNLKVGQKLFSKIS